ncbi:MAG: hypothetical protein JXA77_14060 [Bacteroidales bacterium]|nr:hypothetical protein [Bacteroidales bacterium]
MITQINTKRIKLFCGLFFVFGLLAVSYAQTVVNIYDENDDKLIIELKSLSTDAKSVANIVLVYDSNQFSIETESMLSNTDNVNITFSATDRYLTKSELSSLLAVEMEEDIQMEDWMMKPFECAKLQDCLKPQKDEEMQIEPWMTDLSYWNIGAKNN